MLRWSAAGCWLYPERDNARVLDARALSSGVPGSKGHNSPVPDQTLPDVATDQRTVCACGCGALLPPGKVKWATTQCRDRARPADRHRPGRVDSRKGDRHGPRKRTGDRHTKRFAGVDGESVDGSYTLLAAASDDGWDDWIENTDGLSTQECFDFLVSLPKGQRYWGFAFGYDVNMMLVDVPVALVTRLYETGACYWRSYRIAYTPGKKLTVTKYRRHTAQDKSVVGSCTIWDMFTWIQTSFVTWIDAWQLAPAKDIERIRAMKLQRSTFTARQDKQIRAYCLNECRYLAAGARRLVELIAAAGVNVSTYYSPATISKAMLKREHVTDFRADVPDAIVTPVDLAYAGGRAEVSVIGPVAGPLYQYDIRSAYPAAAIGMPCLVHGRWTHTKPNEHRGHVRYYKNRLTPWSLVRCSWRPKKGHPHPQWGPLPVRPRTGSLRWPTHGTGWYWGVEVLAAARHTQLDIKDVWTWRPSCEHRPFAYLTDLYADRRKMKDDGNPAEYVLKLALNATYGALAEHPHRAQKEPPKFRCLAWAGWITAATRARLLDVLTDDVVLMATDCVLSRSELPVSIGAGLGEWEVKKYDEMFIAGTGIYYGLVDGEWTTTKTRGFESGVLTRGLLTDLWHNEGRTGSVRMMRQRFIGMGTALHRVHGFYPPYARLWRQFVNEIVDKTLDVEPRRAWLTDDMYDGRSIAPTLATHRETERSDREQLARLHTRYDELVRRYEKLSHLVGQPIVESRSERVNRSRAFYRALNAEGQRSTLERMMMIAQQITSKENEAATIFSWADDPSVG